MNTDWFKEKLTDEQFYFGILPMIDQQDDRG